MKKHWKCEMRTTHKEPLKLIAALIRSVDNSKINWKNQSCSQLLNEGGMVGGKCALSPREYLFFWDPSKDTVFNPHPWSAFLLVACSPVAPRLASLSLLFLERFRTPLWMTWAGFWESGCGSLHFSACLHLPSPEATLGEAEPCFSSDQQTHSPSRSVTQALQETLGK